MKSFMDEKDFVRITQVNIECFTMDTIRNILYSIKTYDQDNDKHNLEDFVEKEFCEDFSNCKRKW